MRAELRNQVFVRCAGHESPGQGWEHTGAGLGCKVCVLSYLAPNCPHSR